MFVLLWGGLALYLQYDKAQSLAYASRYGENLARAFAEHITGTFRSLDQTLLGMVRDYEQAPATFDATAAAAKHAVLVGVTFQVSVIGADGYMRVSNLASSSEPVYLADREHFLVHVHHDTGRMFISQPVVGRLSGRSSVQLTRRINTPDGGFGGVMLVSLDPQYISNFYKTIDIGPHGLISVTGLDGIVRARATGDGDTEIGQDLRKADLWAQLARAPNGQYEEPSYIGGMIRLFSYRSLAEYPLIVNVGLARGDVLAAYSQRRQILIAAALAISLIFAAAARLLLHQVDLQITTEEALRRREQELTASRNEANLANRAKSEFLANMSHELRTPLNAIIGFSEFMASGALGPTGSPKYLEYARDIGSSGKHLLDMISEILDMSKIEAGQFDVVPEAVALEPVAEFCLRLVAGRAEAEQITLTNLVEKGLPKVHADERALKQILLNLLSNAVKFTRPGGRVTVSAAPDRQMMKLVVADTGVGIAPEDIQRIGEPFRQLGGALNKPHEGTGLGLAITKRLVALHGGSLFIESEPGKGTAVMVKLPLATASDRLASATG
ncbi:MAG TPA: ATP-binding protein [Alphaproteobacteria bacterium]